MEDASNTLPPWPKRRVVVYAPEKNSSLNVFSKVFAPPSSFQLIFINDSVERCFENLIPNNVSLFILTQCSYAQAFDFVRRQSFHPFAMLIPSLLINTGYGSNQLKALENFGHTQALSDKLSQTSLCEGLWRLYYQWTKGYLASIEKSREFFSNKLPKQGFDTLKQIFRDEESPSLAACALSIQFRRAEDIKTAEKILIACLKKNEPKLSVYIQAIDLYLNYASPYKAHTYIEQARSIYSLPDLFIQEGLQAHLMMNDLNAAYTEIKQVTTNKNDPIASKIMPRLSFATGKFDEFDSQIGFKIETLKAFQNAWHLLTDIEARARENNYKARIPKP